MHGQGKRLILAALVLSMLGVFAWTIQTQPPAPATIRPAKLSNPAAPLKESPVAPAAPASPDATVPADGGFSPVLERLVAAFSGRTEVPAAAGVDIVGAMPPAVL